MATSNTFVVPAQEGLGKAVAELAKMHDLKVTIVVSDPLMSYRTMLTEQRVAFTVKDVAPPDLLAPPKARMVSFMKRLIDGLSAASKEKPQRFSFYLASRKGQDLLSTLAPRRIPTAMELWEEYQASLELQDRFKHQFVLAFVEPETPAASTAPSPKFRTSDFI